MTYLIRKTRLSDIIHLPSVETSAAKAFKAIADLKWLAEGDVMTTERHERALDQGQSWVAIETSSQVPVGFLVAAVIEGDLFIEEISVSKPHQKKGISRTLFETAFAHAKSLGIPAVTITTFKDVPWNAPYYKKLGFVTLETDVRPKYLSKMLKAEEKVGLPINNRCAMRKAF